MNTTSYASDHRSQQTCHGESYVYDEYMLAISYLPCCRRHASVCCRLRLLLNIVDATRALIVTSVCYAIVRYVHDDWLMLPRCRAGAATRYTARVIAASARAFDRR